MVFIPHPNATEEEQRQEVESLEQEAASGESGDKAKQTQRDHDDKKAEAIKATVDSPSNLRNVDIYAAKQNAKGNNVDDNKSDEEDDYDYDEDEDEDPFVLERRRQLNRDSPLPGATSSYSATDRSEYAQMVLREQKQEVKKQQDRHTIPTTMTLEQRLCLSFLKCDTDLIRDKYTDGSTASVVILQSKGAFWETQEDLDLVIAHVGDTRVLLCEAPKGESIQLTTDHHPDAVVESGKTNEKEKRDESSRKSTLPKSVCC